MVQSYSARSQPTRAAAGFAGQPDRSAARVSPRSFRGFLLGSPRAV